VLESNPHRHDIAWRLGLDADVIDPERRRIELKNFIAHWVRPEASRRGRA
jgi:GMP synthase (glutamine-hydrolysing)